MCLSFPLYKSCGMLKTGKHRNAKNTGENIVTFSYLTLTQLHLQH